jgi:hypothetical protein
VLSEHRGSSRHSTTTVRQPGQALAIVCRSFRAGRILIFKTQGSASLHPGLRSITPSAFSQVLPPENALIADCFYAKQILRDKSRRRAPFPNLWGKSSALDPTPPFAKWQTHIKFSIFRVDLGARPAHGQRPARRSGPPASPGRVASERDPAKEARFTSRSHLRFLDVEAAVIDHRLIEHFDIFSDHLGKRVQSVQSRGIEVERKLIDNKEFTLYVRVARDVSGCRHY